MSEEQNIPFIEAGKELFKTPAVFERGVTTVEQLPTDNLLEFAFAGRSNVGKSSLINALTGVSGLARASNTPGRTQELNFFKLGDTCHIVDLPGYGYAAAPEKAVQAWTQLIHAYLRGRVQLRRVFLLIDARHGVMKNDQNIMRMLDKAAVTYQIVLTKTDKVPAALLPSKVRSAHTAGHRHVACYPQVLATSAQKKQGIDLLRAEFAKALSGV